MPSVRRFSTEVLVIRRMDYGEADQILTLYTPDHGKLHAVAKGIRKSTSRSAGHLDLFSRSIVMFYRGRNLGIVSQPQLLEHFDALRTDLAALGMAHYVCELVDAFVPDDLPNPELYSVHLETLRRLATSPAALSVRSFELALLDAAGYRPELYNCLSCGRPIGPGGNSFSVAFGGILCPECEAEDSAAKPIGDTALKLLRNLQTNADQAVRLESVDEGATREIEARVHEYITFRLERRPKSVAVLDRMERHLAAAR